jgi:hypothetical protein
VRAINADEAQSLAATRRPVTDAALRALLHLDRTAPHGRVAARSGSATTTAGERLSIEVYDGLLLPARLRYATTPTRRVTLLLDDRGATQQDNTIDALVRNGQHVLAVDVRGTGSLAPLTASSGYSPAYQFAARAWLLGTSVVAWQVHDIHASLAVIDSVIPGGSADVTIHARGQTAAAALFAAQHLRPSALVLEESLLSYGDFVAADTHDELALAVIPGVLRVTDLPELMARLAPLPVTLVRPRGPDGRSVQREQVAARLGGTVPANVTVR